MAGVVLGRIPVVDVIAYARDVRGVEPDNMRTFVTVIRALDKVYLAMQSNKANGGAGSPRNVSTPKRGPGARRAKASSNATPRSRGRMLGKKE